MKDKIRKSLIQNGFDSYLFYTPLEGSEVSLCEQLNRKYQDSYYLTLRKMIHRSKEGKKWDEEVLLLSHYLFAYVRKGEAIDFLSEIGSMIYIQDLGNNGKLTGENFSYVKWILDIDGLLGKSSAVLENGLVRITGGPLLKMEKSIKKYSRRNRNCLISFEIAGVRIETWLPFEWEDGVK